MLCQRSQSQKPCIILFHLAKKEKKKKRKNRKRKREREREGEGERERKEEREKERKELLACEPYLNYSSKKRNCKETL